MESLRADVAGRRFRLALYRLIWRLRPMTAGHAPTQPAIPGASSEQRADSATCETAGHVPRGRPFKRLVIHLTSPTADL